MADGGSWADVWHGCSRGFDRGVKLLLFRRFWPFAQHVWFWGHNDQRGSWLCHTFICLGTTQAVGAMSGRALGYAIAATVLMVLYGLREIGDARAHRKRQDWDKVDRDTDWQGKQKRGVTAAYDGWGDFVGPLAHWLGTLPLWWLA